MTILRLLVALFGFAMLSACAGQTLEEKPAPLGNFKLGLNIVLTDKMEMVPISRKASAEEWKAAMTKAIADRFGRYDGDRFFNIGVSVDAYALAPPGIPLVASPRSVLVINASVFDDAAGTKLNPDGKRFTVFESVDGSTVLGSGLTKSKQQQIDTLAFNAAKQLEDYMREHPEWFGTYAGGNAGAILPPDTLQRSPMAPMAGSPVSGGGNASAGARLPATPAVSSSALPAAN